MMIYRMDHVGFVVEDLAAAVAFFVELGLELEGEAAVEGEWVDQLVGLDGVRADLAFVRTPDGHSRVELSTFHTPAATGVAPRAPVNTPGIPRITFAVDAVDDVLHRLRAHGAELVGEVAQYANFYRYCYVRGPEGVIIGLVEKLD
ncbi:VOC family protein [Streptomyces sp. NBC_01725]|uniref:VOC family protein n=1 Tax=Streptomyces sp. NBC_01725 TaxID=2975923 RepID=UPI002E2D4E04|nr:VOC family protein [Streptomyces sp. NBC_01725]